MNTASPCTKSIYYCFQDPQVAIPTECAEVNVLEPMIVETSDNMTMKTRSGNILASAKNRPSKSLPSLHPAPLSPSSSAMVSDTDTLASPPVGQSHNSSPNVGQSDPQSPSMRSSSKRAPHKATQRRTELAALSTTSGDIDHALSPLVSEGGTAEDGTTSSAHSVVTLARRWRRGLLSALSTLCSHRHAYVFMHPVTEDIAPGYSSVVYEPVDLTSLRKRLEAALASITSGSTGSITSASPKQILIDAATGFIRDLMLMFVNARMYNSSNHEVHKMAGDMFNDIIGELKPLWSVLEEDIPGFPSLPLATRQSVPVTVRSVTRPPATGVTPTTSPTSIQPPKNPETPVSKAPAPSTRSVKRPASKLSQRLQALTSIDVTKDERDGKVRDVCRKAIWSLSSCKPGHGIEQLMDGSTDTFWQSDGPQPHCVTIQFPQKTTLVRLCLYTDYKADESYTPSR
ncbi:unnamed protein product [Echinostoma caproni]|uniref:Anaphase-promoting complex subunit 10 n=1 Tax=Echinostoma caproni TaxID=27848 RepID=A0A183AU88_9TREM|nr:unnamed protein product [Echinostoma caproni]